MDGVPKEERTCKHLISIRGRQEELLRVGEPDIQTASEEQRIVCLGHFLYLTFSFSASLPICKARITTKGQNHVLGG